MDTDPLPTGAQMRRRLLSRCKKYCRESGMAPSKLAQFLSGNSGFIHRLTNGGNITLDTFDGVMARLDRLEKPRRRRNGKTAPAAAAKAASAKKKSIKP
jgi:hypothetical protein